MCESVTKIQKSYCVIIKEKNIFIIVNYKIKYNQKLEMCPYDINIPTFPPLSQNKKKSDGQMDVQTWENIS